MYVQTAADGSSPMRARPHKRRVSCHEIMVILCVENPTTTIASIIYIYTLKYTCIRQVALLVAGHVRCNFTACDITDTDGRKYLDAFNIHTCIYIYVCYCIIV